MSRDVVDNIRRIEGITRLLTEVVDLGSGLRVAIFVSEDIVLEGSCNSQSNPVGISVQRVLLGRGCGRSEIVRVIPEAVDVSLIDDEGRAAVKRAASAYGVAHAVVEGADARARHV